MMSVPLAFIVVEGEITKIEIRSIVIQGITHRVFYSLGRLVVSHKWRRLSFYRFAGVSGSIIIVG